MARRPFSLLLPVAVLLATAFSREGLAQTPAALSMPEQLRANVTRMVAVRVDSVLAANTQGGIDSRLEPLVRQLRSLNYSTYRLLVHQQSTTQCGKMVTFTLPGGTVLDIEPHSADNDMILMKLVLFQGDRHWMSADLKLMNHGVLLLGPGRYHDGMLIISVGADTLGRGAPSAAQQTQATAGSKEER